MIVIWTWGTSHRISQIITINLGGNMNVITDYTHISWQFQWMRHFSLTDQQTWHPLKSQRSYENNLRTQQLSSDDNLVFGCNVSGHPDNRYQDQDLRPFFLCTPHHLQQLEMDGVGDGVLTNLLYLISGYDGKFFLWQCCAYALVSFRQKVQEKLIPATRQKSSLQSVSL